jgi:hypothetical protein
MNTLNLGSDEIPATKKKSNTRNLKIALGLAAVILVPTIGSTLAGSITVSSDSIEFGQGIATAAACGNVTLTPSTSFDNAVDATGVFKLGTITLTLPSTCTTKTFTIRAWGTDSDTAVAISTRENGAVRVTPTYSDSSCTAAIPELPITANETVASCTANSGTATVPITLAGTLASAADIYKFTVETA